MKILDIRQPGKSQMLHLESQVPAEPGPHESQPGPLTHQRTAAQRFVVR